MAAATAHRFTWQQTMLRIKDPTVSVPFYEKHYGFQLVHTYDFPQWNFSLYFMAILPEVCLHTRQHTKHASARAPAHAPARGSMRQHVPTRASMRQHARQHTRQHTPARVNTRPRVP